MNIDIIIGIILTVCSLAAITALTIWARASIEKRGHEGYKTAREIINEKSRQ
ncbi:hypothetical protein SMSP2_02901 [Limihaloglobus sulfuriphilus]|uniref:Uncharacterized protein n=1 Tax=Limihaloglobus sulfuriphilus TaxID=1851148 RepID=A0A1Q2MIH7_9BACT|nr:hypothetical protein [Limihaloglobus sulfuriphilus]AQQ72515.1 hypothetical protein SMSP2_02901 [Limihaloglobus sulfuriphilus]